jgi:hypothetical protein
MPKVPASQAQLAMVQAKAKQGVPWAEKTAKEWHGKHFGRLPKHVKGKKGRKKGRRGTGRGGTLHVSV